MRRILKIFGWGLFITLGILLATLFAGNAVHWEREPPYEFILSWGQHGTAPGSFNEPTGIAIARDEVFVTDARNARIQVFDKKGGFRRSFGEESLARPMNPDIAGDRLYVPDYHQDVIHVFSLDGTHIGSLAPEEGLNSPGGVAVRQDGSLLVADTYSHRVIHLATNGQTLATWGSPGEPGRAAGQFRYPTDVAVAADGGFYVADGYNHRIQQFGPDGRHLRKWGGPFALGIAGPFKGWITTATGVAVHDKEGAFVADFFNQRIQKFSSTGRFQVAFGEPVNGPQPGAIAVAVDDAGTLFIASFGGHRVERWEPQR